MSRALHPGSLSTETIFHKRGSVREARLSNSMDSTETSKSVKESNSEESYEKTNYHCDSHLHMRAHHRVGLWTRQRRPPDRQFQRSLTPRTGEAEPAQRQRVRQGVYRQRGH